MFVKFSTLKSIIFSVVNHGDYSSFTSIPVKENKYISRCMQMDKK